MINFPYALDSIPAEQYGAMNAYIESTLNNELLNITQVKDEYKISHQLQYQMIKDNKIPGHFMVGNSHLYLACLAKPWFEQYVAKQIARASAEEAKKADKAKGRGRPKKDKNEYEYTLFGQSYKTNEPWPEVERKWLEYLRGQYPQYFNDEPNREGIYGPKIECMQDLDGSVYPEYRATVGPAFMEIRAAFNKVRISRL